MSLTINIFFYYSTFIKTNEAKYTKKWIDTHLIVTED